MKKQEKYTQFEAEVWCHQDGLEDTFAAAGSMEECRKCLEVFESDADTDADRHYYIRSEKNVDSQHQESKI